MRNNVVFRHPATFVPVSTGGKGVLSVEGATWFVSILRRVPALDVDAKLCQEDWGVVVFASRHGYEFWIGLNVFDKTEWNVHVHHGSFAWLQRLRASGRRELSSLLEGLDFALKSDAAVGHIRWYSEGDMSRAKSEAAASPAG